jgi:hypothetical protein
MATVKLSILLSNMRNRLGNVVFPKWRKTNYVRQHVTYSQGSTPKQAEVRSAFSLLVLVWKTMRRLMQASWNLFSTGQNMTGTDQEEWAGTYDVAGKPAITKHALSLCRKSDNFKLCFDVGIREDRIDSLHNRVFNQIFATIPTLKHRQFLQNDDGFFIDFKRQIGGDLSHIGSAYVAFHRFFLLFNS